jgi:CheY-like chemotaxis protein
VSREALDEAPSGSLGEASGEALGEASGEALGEALSVLVVADDLMWSVRLVSQARAAGAIGRTVRDLAALHATLAADRPDLVVVDLSARLFDGVTAVAAARTAGLPVIAISQHEEHDLRKRALAAGAQHVYANAKMHADGVAVLTRWLAAPVVETSAG